MFTGLIREVGRVVSFDDGRLTIEAAQEAALGDSIAIDGVCLTVVAHERGTLAFEAVPETLARTSLGTLEAGSRVNLEPALRVGDPLGGHYVQGHVDGVGACAASSRRVRASGSGPTRRRVAALRVEKGSIALQGDEPDGRRARRARLRRRPDPAHAAGDDARRPRARRPGQPRGRRAREIRRAAVASVACRDGRDHTVRDDRGCDRGHPRGPHGHRRRRRGPRERGRPDDRRPVRDAGRDQLHGDARARADLPLPDRGARRHARPAPDDRSQRGAARHRVHRLGRGARGRDDRHLRGRPQPHDPGRDPSGVDRARPRAAGPRLPAPREARRRARADRPDRGGRRPRPPRGAEPVRRRLRDHERRRHDGPRRRPRALLRAPRPEDGHRRRPRRVPAPAREARRARRLPFACRPPTASSPRSRSARS